jgi:hypothetical protein
MIEDDILRSIREFREAFAKSHDYDMGSMIADLQRQQEQSGLTVIRREPRRPEGAAPQQKEPDQQPPQTGAA